MFKKNVIIIIFLIGIIAFSLLGVRELFHPYFYTSHDGEGHVIRMVEFYQAVKDGQLPVRWSKRLYFGYGYPFFNFNYPSVYYMGTPFMSLGYSAEDAVKGVTILTFVLSGVFMYLYLSRKVRPEFAFLGAALYIYAPYRMMVMYVRGSVAESMAFLFPPLLLWCAESIVQKQKRSIPFTALVVGLLGISHNISALLLFGLFLSYLVFISIGKKDIRGFIRGLIGFGWGVAISSFFSVIALAEKKYTFLDQTIAKDYPDHFVWLFQLIKNNWGFGSSVAGPNDGLSFNVGWIHLGGFFLAILVIVLMLLKKKWRIHDDTFSNLLYHCIVFVGAVFFMTSVSKPLWIISRFCRLCSFLGDFSC